MAMPTGVSMPPPTPCTTRNATSCPRRLGQAAQRRATANTASATRNTRLVPKRSPSQPLAGIDTARPRVAEDDPLDRLGLEFLTDRGQGDGDDRRVEQVEEQRRDEDRGDDVLVGHDPPEDRDRRSFRGEHDGRRLAQLLGLLGSVVIAGRRYDSGGRGDDPIARIRAAADLGPPGLEIAARRARSGRNGSNVGPFPT